MERQDYTAYAYSIRHKQSSWLEVKNVKKAVSKDVEILFEQQNKEFRKSHQEMKATLDELLNATRKEKSASP